jgi:hypothetical protein
MKPSSCLEQYADLMKNCALGAIPQVEHARGHDVLYLSYRNNYGRAQEDLCQMLIKDIRDALRLGAKLLAADLLIVLGLAVGAQNSKMLNPRKNQAA